MANPNLFAQLEGASNGNELLAVIDQYVEYLTSVGTSPAGNSLRVSEVD